jgi:hypothetical protein
LSIPNGIDLAGLLHHLYFGGGVANPSFGNPGAEQNPGAVVTPHRPPAVIGQGLPTPAPAPAPYVLQGLPGGVPLPPQNPGPGPYTGIPGGVHPAIVALLHAIGNHLGQAGNIHSAPGIALHETGHNAQGAHLWEQHHPGAMRTGHFIPDWVRHQMHPNQGRTAVHPATIQ